MDLLRATGELFGDSHQKGDDIYIGSFSDAVKATKKQLETIKAKAKEIDAYDIKEKRKREVVARLSEIDAQSLRPLRAIQNGTSGDFEVKKLADFDVEANALRAELAGIK